MKSSDLTVIFWNIWAYTQDGHIDASSKLVCRLKELIEECNPDVFGLNEVMMSRRDHSSSVIQLLTARGYHCHFALISPTNNEWLVGNLIATKNKPTKIQEHVIGPDTQAARRGYEGCSVKAVEVELIVNNISITILLNYLCSLLPLDWRTHSTHRKNYEKAVRTIANKNLIIGGDFNETKYMLPWLRLQKPLKRKTGSLFHPTWRLNGQMRYLACANYDNIVYSEVGELHLKTFKVLPRQPSDHAPLLGIFGLVSFPKGV